MKKMRSSTIMISFCRIGIVDYFCRCFSHLLIISSAQQEVRDLKLVKAIRPWAGGVV